MRLQLAAILFATVATGCVVRASGGAYVRPAPVYTTTTVSTGYVQPELVEVSPGVMVVYDYDEPVFYSDNYYWRYNSGTWYRSSMHNSGWTVYGDVPMSVRTINQPHNYVHYRPANYQPRSNYQVNGYNNNGGPRTGPQQPQYQPQPQGPVVRDHRDPYVQPQPQPQGPIVRDHRDPQPPPPQPQGPVVRDHRNPVVQPVPPQPQGPTVRDHRQPQPAPPPPPPPSGGPTVRDHRH